jgi:hypothetical protein
LLLFALSPSPTTACRHRLKSRRGARRGLRRGPVGGEQFTPPHSLFRPELSFALSCSPLLSLSSDDSLSPFREGVLFSLSSSLSRLSSLSLAFRRLLAAVDRRPAWRRERSGGEQLALCHQDFSDYCQTLAAHTTCLRASSSGAPWRPLFSRLSSDSNWGAAAPFSTPRHAALFLLPAVTGQPILVPQASVGHSPSLPGKLRLLRRRRCKVG